MTKLILAFRNFCAHAQEAYKGRGGIAALFVGYVLRGSDQRARASMCVQAIGVFCVLLDSDRLVAQWRH